MPSSGTLRRVALVRTDVSEERITFVIRAFLLSLVRLLVSANVCPGSPTLVILMMKAIRTSETSVITRATRRNILEDCIRHSRRRENLNTYTLLTGWDLYRRRNVLPVRYELDFHISEDGILHSHRREYLKSYRDIISFL
jgi:hypothetical protein